MFPVNGIEHYLPLYPFSWRIVGVSVGALIDGLYLLGFVVVLFSIILNFYPNWDINYKNHT